MQTKILNLFGGPGSGKSTTAAGVFTRLKLEGRRCEYVQEYAKDLTWKFTRKDGTRIDVDDFAHQEYIFAKQFARIRRLIGKVEWIITDSPVLLGLIYTPKDYELPSLRNVILEAHSIVPSMNYFIERRKEYDPVGRNQTEIEAVSIDLDIVAMLNANDISYSVIYKNEDAIQRLGDLIMAMPPEF